MTLAFALIFGLEIFFIYKDSLSFKNFKKQNPSKKEIIKFYLFGFLRICIFIIAVLLLSFLLNIIPALYYWNGRNVELIEAIRPELNTGFKFYRFIFYFLFPLSLIYVVIIKVLKRKISLSITFPLITFFGLLFLVMLLFDYDLKYYKNPLADTRVSPTFKPLNVPLLKEGMSKKEVLELLGDPIYEEENKLIYAEENGWGWYDYLCLDIFFENDTVVKIYKRWKYED